MNKLRIGTGVLVTFVWAAVVVVAAYDPERAFLIIPVTSIMGLVATYLFGTAALEARSKGKEAAHE